MNPVSSVDDEVIEIETRTKQIMKKKIVTRNKMRTEFKKENPDAHRIPIKIKIKTNKSNPRSEKIRNLEEKELPEVNIFIGTCCFIIVNLGWQGKSV